MDGTTSALSLLMEEDRFERYYRTNQVYCNWGRFLELMCHSNPSLRILEIGAGTGVATAHALKSLVDSRMQKYAKYTFTDISSAFFVAAKQKFGEFKNIEYKVLDISRDPKEQGYISHEYDLIIASNVLHATPSLRNTLENVHVCYYTSYGQGTLAGWWIGELDGKQHAPYVSPVRWDEELRGARFKGVEALMDDVKAPLQTSSTMLSSIINDHPTKGDITLLTSQPPGEWAKILFHELTSLCYNVRWGTLDDSTTADELVISLLEVEQPFLHDLSS
ncbi:hypothetical protein FE257_004943 [Aspergillus nanangensis]|uniref:Methyltransferase type 12 domain-containing protein n=1 Tax=Aspergillus nanangensis TaxID=2582783 RepID=A0AAD4CBP9_ASPNN|nr:hypothetical protein FE257_004943 [Aspergillus nanangensis]